MYFATLLVLLAPFTLALPFQSLQKRWFGNNMFGNWLGGYDQPTVVVPPQVITSGMGGGLGGSSVVDTGSIVQTPGTNVVTGPRVAESSF